MFQSNKIKKLIFRSNLYDSLIFSQALIEDINNSDYYNLDITDIESALIDKIFSLVKNDLPRKYSTSKDTLFIISQGYITGGHTRLMENLSQMMPNKCPLLITRTTEDHVINRLERYFSTITKCFNNKDDLVYIQKLSNEIQAYEKVILNTHPDDIHTIIACALAKKINSSMKIYFVNHADHLASFGVTVADVWFEISLCGQQLDKDRGFSINTKKSFLGIPINKQKNQFFQPVSYNYNPQGTSFLTAAAAYKYNINENNSIEPLARRILSLNCANQISFIGSGIETNPILLPLKNTYSERLHFISSLPYDEYLLLTQNTDFYIDSYPITGGTAFVEQFINGKPCIGLRSNFYGYTPLDLIKRDTVDEVIELLTQKPPTQGFISDLQSKIFEVHGFENVKYRFLTTLYENVFFQNPMVEYIPQKPVNKSKKLHISKGTRKKGLALDKKMLIKLLTLKAFGKK
ncbi:hypothetical protein [Psychrobacter jeotgali]|uniref:hypothetical protein n=1 Tax=Psychrobacter jeotgali TaxID=179010 RepID=UPI00191853B2|nr:hypothetical protein [Psychrobacter jeotgali]